MSSLFLIYYCRDGPETLQGRHILLHGGQFHEQGRSLIGPRSQPQLQKTGRDTRLAIAIHHIRLGLNCVLSQHVVLSPVVYCLQAITTAHAEPSSLCTSSIPALHVSGSEIVEKEPGTTVFPCESWNLVDMRCRDSAW